MDKSILFTPGKIGPLTLRNRTIRAAAFESMCPGNAPSEQLFNYHTSVAAGGIGMTNIAYAAVTQSGLMISLALRFSFSASSPTLSIKREPPLPSS